MRKVAILACTLAIVSAVTGFAQTPSVAPLTNGALAAILGRPAVNGACPTPRSEVLFAATRPGGGLMKSACTATASCGGSSTVSCSGVTTCSAYDRNCAIQEQGHVTCDNITHRCPLFCPIPWCDQCDATGDCYACCRCAGGSGPDCAAECN